MTRTVELVSVDEEGRGVLFPVRCIAKRAARVLKHAEAVVVRPTAVRGINYEEAALALEEESSLNDGASSNVGRDKLPIELGACDGCVIFAAGVGIFEVADVEDLTVNGVNARGAEVLNAVRGGINGGVDREGIGKRLAAEDPFAHEGIVGGSFHNEDPFLAGLGFDSAAGVDIPFAAWRAVHFGSPDVAPDSVALAVREINDARIAVRDDRARVAASEEFEL